MVESKKSFTADEARRFGEEIGIDWAQRRSTSSSSASA